MDAELGSELTADELEVATRYAVTDTAQLPTGVHDPKAIGAGDLLGLLIIEGLMVRTVHVGERHCAELVGPGALLRPWDHFGEHAPMPFEVAWRVIEPTRLALLDDRIMTVSVRWPGLMHAIIKRASERAQTLAFSVGIHCLQHVELRVLTLLWHLADRFGRVTPDGTVIPLALTHSDLAELIGSQRPSVSSCLARLADRGEVARRPDHTWLLPGEPPGSMTDLRNRAQATSRSQRTG